LFLSKKNPLTTPGQALPRQLDTRRRVGPVISPTQVFVWLLEAGAVVDRVES
jgi:hypothetical protein